jgi:peptidyl-prolyl cis-trans isomerase SurA
MTEPENQPVTTPASEPVDPPSLDTEETTVEGNMTDTTEKPEIADMEDIKTSVQDTEVEMEMDKVTPSSEETTAMEDTAQSPLKWQYYAGAAVVLAIIILGLLFVMNKQGRVNIPIFDSIDNFSARQTAVATVNGVDISEYDFNVSVAQITVGAQAQGADLNDPELQNQINTQAMEMLVNTEILKQEAARRGVSVTEEDVTNRLTALEGEVGGADVLQERMTQFNIDNKTLRRDITNELTIQTLLDQVFEETDITVSDEEIDSLYTGAGGAEAGLPPLAEVREQVIAQIRTGKEQEVVTTFIQTLRETATIEIKI